MDELINKVAESGIVTIDPETYIPKDTELAEFDLKDYLHMGLILKEKEYREALKSIDLSLFQDKIVAVHCSADAIIPVWAYMLAASRLQAVCKDVMMGNKEAVKKEILLKRINNLSIADFSDKRIVIKGCGETPIPEEAYLAITYKLQPVAKSIMYGEPCSTVPVFKRKGD